MSKPEARHGKLVTRQDYRAAYDPLQGFERICSLARQRRCLEFLAQARPRRILEVGCGAMILADMARGLDLDHDSWTVAEPEPDFVDAARKAMADDPRFAVLPGYLEDLAAPLRDRAPEGYDAVLLSGLLHETAAPNALLAAALDLTAPGGQVLASVPNAQSFHRLLAVEAGLIPSPGTLGERDRRLGHPVVFDAASFTALLAAAGLTDLALDGYLFKPLTNDQMELVLAGAPEGVVEGLIALGRRFPDQAAEICVIGRKSR